MSTNGKSSRGKTTGLAPTIPVARIDREKLSKDEQKELESLEAVIAQNLAQFEQAGSKIWQALQSIRDKRLYREKFPTFELYCQALWKFGSSRARQLIGAARTVEEIKSVTGVTQSPLLESERCLREIVGIAGHPEILVPTVGRIQERLAAGETITPDLVASEKEAVIAQIVGANTEEQQDGNAATTGTVWGSDDAGTPKKRSRKPTRTPKERLKAFHDHRINVLLFEISKVAREVADLKPSVNEAFARKYISDTMMLDLDLLASSIQFQAAILNELKASTSPAKSKSANKT